MWQNLYPSYSGLAFGGGRFVAVSEDGLIRTSTGGEWSSQVFAAVAGMGGPGRLFSAAYGDGMFLVTRTGDRLLRSENGENWSSSPIMTTNPCRYLAFGGGRFFGVGGAMTFLYFNDDWDEDRAPAATTHLSHAVYRPGTPGRYIAVGNNILHSQHGVQWQPVAVSTPGGVSVVAFNEDTETLVAIAASGATVYTSSDGISWTSSPSNAPAGMVDMAFGNGKFVAVGAQGRAAVSSDGVEWALSALNEDDNFTSVKFGDGVFMALGAYGSVYTYNGTDWSKKADGRLMSYRQVVYGGGVFVAVGDSGVSVSPDGINWNKSAGAPKNLRGVAFGGGKYVVVGDSGAIFVSADDGSSWTDRSHNDRGTMLGGVAYGNGSFVAIGRSSVGVASIQISADGENWEDIQQTGWTVGSYPVSVSFGDGLFVAAGSDDNWRLRSSGNGEFWNNIIAQPAWSNYRIVSVSYANGKFVASGNSTASSAVFSSDSGNNWTMMSTTTRRINSATFAKGFYITVSDSGNIHASTNGSNWVLQARATNRNLQTIYHGDDILLAAGAAGAMLYSSQTPSMVSIRHTAASRGTMHSVRSMTMETRRAPTITLSFTPQNAGTISVYSLTGRQIYKTKVSAGQRTVRLPQRAMSSGAVIVRYSGDGIAITQRFQLAR
jgi:hypothetical protein